MTKNIIIISIDDLRFDCVGYQPDKRELDAYNVRCYLETPTLDGIAERSLCFSQCISTAPYTTAAHASILTGLYPPRHGVRELIGKKLFNDVHSLGEILKVYGYSTLMSTDVIEHFESTDLTRGFDYVIHNDDLELHRKIMAMRKNKESKNFIFVHFFDVHEPYLTSENGKYDDPQYLDAMGKLYGEYNMPFDRSFHSKLNKYTTWNNLVHAIGRKYELFLPLYVRGVTKFDRGRFRDFMDVLRNLGYMDDSLIIVLSDHGEGRMNDHDHSLFGHCGPLFDNVIRVPLMLYHKDIRPGVSDKLVSVVDILPTVLETIINMNTNDLPYPLDGINLLGHSSVKRKVYSETWATDCIDKHWNLDMASSLLYQRALRSETHKYIIYGKPERFDEVASDHFNDEEFLKEYYRCLLARFEPYSEFVERLDALRANRTQRESLLNVVGGKSYCYYDLREDPWELSPVFLSGAMPADMQENFNEILAVRGTTRDMPDLCEDSRNDIQKSLARTLFLWINEDFVTSISGNKHLINELVDKFIENRVSSDEEFVVQVYKTFFGRMPADKELEKDTEILINGLSRRLYFNRRVLNRLSRNPAVAQRSLAGNIIQALEYEEIKGSLIFRVFTKITFLLDHILFPLGTTRGKIFSNLLKKLRRMLDGR
ncbi:MAG TPA: sulfatase-like hydrolase/transferase [Thermodesulfovibrionales bacterium]|nr:sulfatase-like hydrolase/transferase [Thermodesulfovibrionales bacterium]